MRTICADKLSQIIGERTNGLINEGKLGCAEIIVEQDGRCVFHECFGADPVSSWKALLMKLIDAIMPLNG